jgi:hypothetical protein
MYQIRRVQVYHLHLPTQPLVGQERIHHHQRIAEDEAIGPVVPVLIGAEHLLVDRVLRVSEEIEQGETAVTHMAFEGFQDRPGREPFVDEQRQRRHIKRQALRFPCPV